MPPLFKQVFNPVGCFVIKIKFMDEYCISDDGQLFAEHRTKMCNCTEVTMK